MQATIVIMLVALALGCSKEPELVGRWELIEFKSDNSGVMQGKNLQPLMFAWQETAKNSYKIDVNFEGQKKNLKAVVQNGTLLLEGEGGKETYRKVPSK